MTFPYRRAITRTRDKHDEDKHDEDKHDEDKHKALSLRDEET